MCNRKPRVPNKYNLTVKDLKHLVVVDKSKICEPLFWRNNVIDAWCITGATKEFKHDCYDDEFWIGIYDDTAKSYAGKVRVCFSSHGGMCDYKFKKFYNFSEIENELDLQIQELFLEKINYLIDNKILEVRYEN